jgi:hypothetical protein
MDSSLLEVLHDCSDEDLFAIAHSVDVQLDGVSQVLVNQEWAVGC